MKKLTPLVLILCFIACKKNGAPTANLYDSGNIVFGFNETINQGYVYSSFDTSFHQPKDYFNLTPAQLANVDMVYVYDVNIGGGPFTYCFIDPISASQAASSNFDFYNPSFANSVQTVFYATTLTYDDFNAARSAQGKIAEYFADSTKMYLAPSPYYAAGCAYGMQWPLINNAEIIGFKNVKSGKRGLIEISPNQEADWPVPVNDHNTTVEIIREK